MHSGHCKQGGLAAARTARPLDTRGPSPRVASPPSRTERAGGPWAPVPGPARAPTPSCPSARTKPGTPPAPLWLNPWCFFLPATGVRPAWSVCVWEGVGAVMGLAVPGRGERAPGWTWAPPPRPPPPPRTWAPRPRLRPGCPLACGAGPPPGCPALGLVRILCVCVWVWIQLFHARLGTFQTQKREDGVSLPPSTVAWGRVLSTQVRVYSPVGGRRPPDRQPECVLRGRPLRGQPAGGGPAW